MDYFCPGMKFVVTMILSGMMMQVFGNSAKISQVTGGRGLDEGDW